MEVRGQLTREMSWVRVPAIKERAGGGGARGAESAGAESEHQCEVCPPAPPSWPSSSSCSADRPVFSLDYVSMEFLVIKFF